MTHRQDFHPKTGAICHRAARGHGEGSLKELEIEYAPASDRKVNGCDSVRRIAKSRFIDCGQDLAGDLVFIHTPTPRKEALEGLA